MELSIDKLNTVALSLLRAHQQLYKPNGESIPGYVGCGCGACETALEIVEAIKKNEQSSQEDAVNDPMQGMPGVQSIPGPYIHRPVGPQGSWVGAQGYSNCGHQGGHELQRGLTRTRLVEHTHKAQDIIIPTVGGIIIIPGEVTTTYEKE
jgi:hypothetical protein